MNHSLDRPLRTWRAQPRWPVALTVAGSDSGGGAGVQADLKTWQAMGVFGVSALTALTAQHPGGVEGIWPVPAAFVVRQIETVCAAFPVRAAKTGMLYSATLIRAAARALAAARVAHLVVDPVMIATSGATLLQKQALQALCQDLIPRATTVTPNVPEAEQLLGRRLRTPADLRDAARAIADRFGVACVVKGGHLTGREVVNVLATPDGMRVFRTRRVDARQTHGTGCTFSAALAGALAHGSSLEEAVDMAGRLVGRALRSALRVGPHRPLRI